VLSALKARYQRWRIARHPLPDRVWSASLRAVPIAHRLPRAQRAKLRALVTLFLLDKHYSSAHDLHVTDAMRLRIAIKACLPILELGLGWYSHFKGIVLYPGDFRTHDQYMDETGVVHDAVSDLCGQSLIQGPMVLSWDTITTEHTDQGQDLVIHECAHKLDALNGDAAGFPPLHDNMSRRDWARAFRGAYRKLCDTIESGQTTRIDPYAAEDAAEFFAVVSETFFTRPDIVREDFPEVYQQLVAFYKQDPHPKNDPAARRQS